MRYVLIVLLITGLTGFSCSEVSLFSEKLENISYDKHSACIMDVFLPNEKNTAKPFVILIHGGAWVGGDKHWLNEIQEYLSKNNIPTANINYRLADSIIHYQEMLDDIDNAITFCRNNEVKWGTTDANYIICGYSAGGHLALLSAYTSSQKIKAVVALCPVTDITDSNLLAHFKQISLLDATMLLAGESFEPGRPLPAAYQLASPRFCVKNVPALLIHGTNDSTVPYSQSVFMSEAIAEKGIPHKLVSVPGADHNMNIKEDEATRKWIYGEILEWVKKYGN